MDETLLADDKEKLYRFVDNRLSEKTQALQRCKVLSAEVKMLRDKFKNVSMELKRRFEMFGERGGRILNLDETKDLVEVGKSFIEIDGELEKLIKLHRLEIEKVLKPMKKFSSIDLN
ncbi:hypothetical protein QAD02_010792 [Eretmocerus hayati]|uniref:Uncharacterized protein n=1 Tax=Eretmocerus hayati TaxID=131215 RepID=A0ACC2NV21_9HYME|nr:hypothetical protein QAD02_010792 [Eretmocerus hayati]